MLAAVDSRQNYLNIRYKGCNALFNALVNLKVAHKRSSKKYVLSVSEAKTLGHFKQKKRQEFKMEGRNSQNNNNNNNNVLLLCFIISRLIYYIDRSIIYHHHRHRHITS